MSSNEMAALAANLGTVQVPAMALGPNKVVTALPFGVAARFVPRPTSYSGKKVSAEHAKLAELNGHVQRAFIGAKAKNVKPYSEYILRYVHSGEGYIPRILLWSPEPLRVEGYTLYLPLDAQFLPIDGQTTTEAHYVAAERDPRVREQHVVLEILHGISMQQAAQVFHDSNALGVNVNAATAISRDTRDPITHLTREISRCEALIGKVDETGRQLSKGSPNIITITSLRGMIVCALEGIAGVSKLTRPFTSLTDAELDALTAYMSDALPMFFEHYAKQVADRDNYVIGLPGVLAAIGAVFHDFTEDADADAAMALLRQVDFRSSFNWNGIAINVKPDGKVTVAGGVKGSAGEVYKALTLEGSEAYRRIRQPFQPLPPKPEKKKK